jgi:methionyl-tRNA formyltransferase
VVAAYGRILTPAVLDLPALGCWNVHASLLPAWRGAAPIQWSIIAGDRETGISIMKMDAGLDTGDVALQRTEPICEDDTAATLSARLSRLGAESIREALERLREGALPTTPQRDEGATYAPLLTKADGHLDFRATARTVSCRARGVDPWPGAYAQLGDAPDASRIKLFSPRAVERPSGDADRDVADREAGDHDAADRASPVPGCILGLDAHGLVVACGEGAVSFGELQLPGRKRLPADAVMAGRGLEIGAVLT